MKTKSSPPAVSTQMTSSEFPDELKPYITDILSRAQTRAQAKEEAGYQKYPSPRIAEFAPEQQKVYDTLSDIQAQGISSDPTMRSASTYTTPAYGMIGKSVEEFTPEAAQRFMSPYVQSVIDIQKREAERQGDRQMQDIQSQMTRSSGAFGGSRQGLLESEQMRNEAQLMDDIQAKGLQSAYGLAQQGFESQKGRELQGASALAGLGKQVSDQVTSELRGIEGVGAAKQAAEQQALDLGYQDFLAEQYYPDQVLQEYQSIVRGFPLESSSQTVGSQSRPAPSVLTQAAGAGTALAGLVSAFKKEGGKIVERAEGGLTVAERRKKYRKGGKKESISDLVQDAEAIEEEGAPPMEESPPATKEEAEKKGSISLKSPASASPTDPMRELSAAFDAFNKRNEDYRKLLEEGKKSKAAGIEAAKEALARDRGLELAKFGAGMITAGAEGKGLLEAVAAGAPAGIEGLRRINREETNLSSQLGSLDQETAAQLMALDVNQLKMLVEKGKLDASIAQALIAAKSKDASAYSKPSPIVNVDKNKLATAEGVRKGLATHYRDAMDDENAADYIEDMDAAELAQGMESYLLHYNAKGPKITPEQAAQMYLNDKFKATPPPETGILGRMFD